MDRDQNWLRLLANVQYFVAGIVGLFALLTMMLSVRSMLGYEGPDAPGLLFAVFAAVLAVGAFKIWQAGQSLATRSRYGYCLIVAVMEGVCFLPPLGTIIGGLTIVLLLRPSIRSRFTERPL